jgi:hypothetical protein
VPIVIMVVVVIMIPIVMIVVAPMPMMIVLVINAAGQVSRKKRQCQQQSEKSHQIRLLFYSPNIKAHSNFDNGGNCLDLAQFP